MGSEIPNVDSDLNIVNKTDSIDQHWWTHSMQALDYFVIIIFEL